MPIKKAIKFLKKKAKKKVKKIACSHPLKKRRLIHSDKTSITAETCILCGKEFGEVILSRGKKPGTHEQRLVAEAKKKKPV